jgi:hypothetical protein
VQSPWFSQDFGEKIPLYRTAEVDQQLTFHQPAPAKTCPHYQCISLTEHKEILHKQMLQNQRERTALLTSLNQQMKQFELQLQAEYQQKVETLEKRASSSDLEGTTKTLSDELLRRQFEDQLAEESEKEIQQEREIERLRGLLERDEVEEGSTKLEIARLTKEIQGKDRDIRALTLEIAQRDDFIAELRTRASSIDHLEAEIASLTSENLSLRHHSKPSSLEEALKLSLQELESENSLLKQDYEELLVAHQHALHDRQMAETVRLKTCSPLKRKLGSPESSTTPRSQSREIAEIRKECDDKSDQALYWKTKTNDLAKHYKAALTQLQSDSQLLRSDITTLTTQTSQHLHDLSTLLNSLFH